LRFARLPETMPQTMPDARNSPPPPDWPDIRAAGPDGIVVRFADRLTEPANRAALAFRAAVEGAGWRGVAETSTALVSTFLRLDPAAADPAAILADLRALASSRDWAAASLPAGRRLWRVPALFGTDLAPHLDQAAAQAGLSPAQAVASLTAAPLRVQAIGFAPGQPYLGRLGPDWDLPRQTALNPNVPAGAVVVAIRQIVLFSVASPTGWQHVGQTALRLFDPGRAEPFLLRPGDEVLFEAVDRAGLEAARAAGGGARSEGLS
jgi:KipI family sensor histidine kinase inhibitor